MLQNVGGSIRASKAGDSVAAANKFTNNGGTGLPRSTGDEDFHVSALRSVDAVAPHSDTTSRQLLAQRIMDPYCGDMPRSGVEARQRLQQAALDLYARQGYDNTTTAEIAERAGVNHRTFFRHFPDKREVLFDGQDHLRDALVASVVAQPDSTPPVDALRAAFLAASHVLEDRKEAAAPRLRIIAETPALLERDLAKGAAMAAALSDALRSRGEDRGTAELLGTVCWATFHHAATLWTASPDSSLDGHIVTAFDLLASCVRQSTTPV